MVTGEKSRVNTAAAAAAAHIGRQHGAGRTKMQHEARTASAGDGIATVKIDMVLAYYFYYEWPKIKQVKDHQFASINEDEI